MAKVEVQMEVKGERDGTSVGSCHLRIHFHLHLHLVYRARARSILYIQYILGMHITYVPYTHIHFHRGNREGVVMVSKVRVEVKGKMKVNMKVKGKR